MTRSAEQLATVGRDNGMLTAHLERLVSRPPEQVLRELALSEPSEESNAEAVRWEVDGVDGGSRVALTMWIDDSDLDAAAATGAVRHDRFERLVRMLDADPAGGAPDDLDVAALADQYSNVFAAALANTD